MRGEKVEAGIPFRLRIGVTGRRRLPDAEALSSRIDEALDVHIPGLIDPPSRNRIQRSTLTPLAFTVLSSLAEGADRLVSETVLKRPDAQIEVVLPLTVGDYLEDFKTAESRAEFERRLAEARRPISLRETPLAADFLPGELAEARTQAYEDVGRYVVTHCDVLLALWDGEESHGRGGTADVARYARSVGRPVVVIHNGKPGRVDVYAGHGIQTGAFFAIDGFNSFEVPGVSMEAYVAHMYEDLFDNPPGRALPAGPKAAVRENLLPYYVRASLMAKRKQRFYLAAGSVAYSFAVLAVAVVALGALFLENTPLVFAAEALILGVSFVTVLLANHQRTHRGWIESRFLAERLRAACFLAACGLESSPVNLPPGPGGGSRPGGWMEMVFAEIMGRMPVLDGCSEDACRDETAFIREVWVEGQIKYHRAKARKNSRLSRRMETGGLAVFALALIAPLLHLFLFRPLNLVADLGGGGHEEFLAALMTFCALVLPALGAAFGGIRMHREYSRLARRSRDMVVALQNLSRSFERVRTPKQLEAAVRQTEALMLLEAEDWLSLTAFSALEYVA